MYEDDPYDQAPSTNRSTLFLLLGSGLLLVAAAVVFYLRGGGNAPPEPKQFRVEQTADIPGPLVADTDIVRPIAQFETTAAQREGRVRSKEETKAEPPRGTIDAGTANRFINEHFVLLKACYERRLKLNPMLEGKLDLNIGISVTGRVTSVRKSKDTVGDPEMWQCVRKTIRGWRFPKPTGGSVEIAKVFDFRKRL